MRSRSILIATAFALLAACGGGGNNPNDAGDGTGDGGPNDGGCSGLCTDAPPFGGECTPGGAQCSNCVDDDGDGDIDGFDLECSGALDNDEGSFSTGIPGDNVDAVMQDCFFDGNSGAGNDGCNIHVCCLLGAQTVAECPIGANRYNPASCPPPLGTTPLSQQCTDTCGALTPPGCDCFGCCTICDPNDPTQCYDILTNPAASPGCDESTLADPNVCRRCTKTTSCGNDECGGDTCILCPGQDPSTLPEHCNEMPTCPDGVSPCGPDNACGPQTYCSNGCCIGVIQ